MIVRKVNVEREARTARGYALPIKGDRVQVSQGYHGPHSHFAMELGSLRTFADDSFCVDFAVPVNTNVKAAKDGVVHTIIESSSGPYRGINLQRGMESRPTFMILEHEDGLFSLYSHLAPRTFYVAVGAHVEQGETIAWTGESGWVGPDPHLHFGVYDLFFRPHMFEGRRTSRLSQPVEFDDYKCDLEHASLEELCRDRESVHSEIFWFKLRNMTDLRNLIGRGLCDVWANQAKDILDSYPTSHSFEVMVAADKPAVTIHKIASHYWLESPVPGGIFIADGTAGQIDQRYPEGYYGLCVKAPRPLRDIYCLGEKA